MRHVELELTPAQQDIYLEGKLFGSVLNNIGGYQKYRCRLDVPRFQQAREHVLFENDAYRLRFHETGGECEPFITDDPPPALRIVDCPTETAAHEWIQAQFEIDFADISSDVFQDALVKLSDDEYWYFAKAHHLIMDGWGFALQMQRFLQTYEKLAEPVAAAHVLASSCPSFAQYMSRQSGYRDSTHYGHNRSHWLAQHARPTEQMFEPSPEGDDGSNSRRVSVALDTSLIDALRHLAGKADASLVAVMYAALYVYFSRAYQRSEMAIGSPVHNRRNAIDKDIIGSIVNVNAHRIAAPADSSFFQLLGHVASVQRQDYRHSRFPLGDLVRALREVHATTSPLFEIAFNYQKLDFQLAIHDQVVETHYLSHSHERVPLTFVLCEYGEGRDVWLHLDYNTRYFDETEATALLGRLVDLLHQVSEDGTRPIGEYRLMTAAEWHNQSVAWQGATIPLDEGLRIHDFFEQQTRRIPDDVAVTCGQDSLTYAQLNERADKLAVRLMELGAGPDRLVGICHGRTLNLLPAMLAVLKSGSAYVPIDPAYPPKRVRYIVDDAQVALVVADARGRAALGSHGCSIVDPDDVFAQPLLHAAGPTRSVGVTGADLAYVIYTSGSTGNPKGVLIEHRNAAAFIQWALGYYAGSELSSVLASTSICFDLSIFELFVTLAAGGRVVLVENVLALRNGDVDELSLINTVPSAIRGLLDAKAIPSSIRCINLAGELLRQDLVDALYDLGTSKVYDLYGPSEDTTYSTACLRTRGGETSIGRPIAHTQVYVLDDAGDPLPPGILGELYIGGAGLARGYLHQPALTDEKFVFNRHSNSRLYRTGDVVRFMADGRLQYLGRKDAQVKVRGYRIEPGEIEACLLEHPSVADCVVVGREITAQSGKSLVAYIVAQPGHGETGPSSELPVADLATFVAERLPAYMVPSHFMSVPALALTPNGKVDRLALSMAGDIPREESPHEERGYIAPANDIEQRLHRLWGGVLNQERIGTRDDFFSRGGDSLLLLKLASAIEHEFGHQVDQSSLFASLTIDAQARLLSHQIELARLLESVSVSDEAQPGNYVDL